MKAGVPQFTCPSVFNLQLKGDEGNVMFKYARNILKSRISSSSSSSSFLLLFLILIFVLYVIAVALVSSTVHSGK